MVNNDNDIKDKFGSILWIGVGQDVSVAMIYSRVGKFLDDGGLKFEAHRRNIDLESQRTYLMNAFGEKQVLVILDDVWGNMEKNRPMVHWLDIFKGAGSITLITTRDNGVLVRVKATHMFEVKSLSKEESWELFSFHAFESNIPLSHKVEDIAKKICVECKGLPLALEVIGGALRYKQNVIDWEHALSCMKKSKSWMDARAFDELFHRLKYSYDMLSEHAKRCFLYFAAFPEDYRISTEQLYFIWQVEQLFGSCDVEDAKRKAKMNLISLVDQSLIELDEDGQHAKIHDILRDLAF